MALNPCSFRGAAQRRAGIAPPPVLNDNSQVDDWAESELAWQLVDAIGSSVAAVERAHLYAAIGSGEAYTAITAVLRMLVRDAIPLSAKLKTELTGWLAAYRHSAEAPGLLELLSLIEAAR